MIVTLLTDFGLADHYVGVMKGVVLGVDARIRVVDLTHGIEPEARVFEVTTARFTRQPRSSTFHGRDLFAPVGAALATGILPEELGPPLATPVRLAPLRPEPTPKGALRGRIVHVDRFGNWSPPSPVRTSRTRPRG